MKIVNVNAPEKSGRGGFAPDSGRVPRFPEPGFDRPYEPEEEAEPAPARRGLRGYGVLGFVLTGLNVTASCVMATASGSPAALAEAILAVLLIGLPSALLYRRGDFYAALWLAGFYALNTLGSLWAVFNGLWFATAGSAVFSAGFTVVFIFAAKTAYAQRRASS